MKPVEAEDLEIGKKYVVEFGDCCVGGVFIAKFEGQEADKLKFDNAVVLVEWSGVSFEEEENE